MSGRRWVLRRSGYGSAGEKIIIVANHFKVDIGNIDLHQYDVTITPLVTSKNMRRFIMEFLINNAASSLDNRLLAYDGKSSAFAAGPLPFVSKSFEVIIRENNGRVRKFEVNIKFAAQKNLYPLRQFLEGIHPYYPKEAIQVLDMVLRESASKERVIVGKSVFHHDFGKGPLGDGMEYWKGFYQSLRPTQMGLSLTIDMSARAFYEPVLLQKFVEQLLGTAMSSSLTDKDRIKVERAIKGVMVEVRRQNYKRRYKVQGLTAQPISQLNFIDKTGSIKTVVGYFSENYNGELRFPALPAIQAGTDAKPVYLPMEICWVTPDQRYALKLNERQVTQFLKATCQPPRAREDTIHNTIKQNKYNEDHLVSQHFGMKVTNIPAYIEARVLPPPTLRYHGSASTSELNPSVGQWNMSRQKVINGGTVNYWSIINFSKHDEKAVGRFVHGLVCTCQAKGIVFNQQPLIPMRSAMPQTIEKALAELQSQALAQLARVAPGQQLQMLFVILPETKGSYSMIKRVCEIDLGIVSQCFKPQHVLTLSKQYFENVSLKINVKAGGRNTVLSAALNFELPYVTDQPTIIVGADVIHPRPGEDSSPSIAAVVASIDWPQVTKYKAVVSSQPHRQEIIEDLNTLIRELVNSFVNETGQVPERLIFYRGGVSEGHINEDVWKHEMGEIQKALAHFIPVTIHVTFIVVQKRHHTRFFPLDRTDESGNILPGTVVDTDICHPYEFDFYLCSHAGIQGTSRPTYYHVLYNQNTFTSNGLQMLTNSLCYTYARCTRSVSIVPPVYYARLAATRARSYIEGDQSDSSLCDQRATKDCVAEVRPLPVIHDNVKNVMFYC